MFYTLLFVVVFALLLMVSPCGVWWILTFTHSHTCCYYYWFECVVQFDIIIFFFHQLRCWIWFHLFFCAIMLLHYLKLESSWLKCEAAWVAYSNLISHIHMLVTIVVQYGIIFFFIVSSNVLSSFFSLCHRLLFKPQAKIIMVEAWSYTLGGIFDFVVIMELQSLSISFEPETYIISHSCFCLTFVTTMLGFVVLMAFSSMFHDINSINENFPTFTIYDNNYNVGNVQSLHEIGFEMEIPTVDGVDAHRVVEAHL